MLLEEKEEEEGGNLNWSPSRVNNPERKQGKKRFYSLEFCHIGSQQPNNILTEALKNDAVLTAEILERLRDF